MDSDHKLVQGMYVGPAVGVNPAQPVNQPGKTSVTRLVCSSRSVKP